VDELNAVLGLVARQPGLAASERRLVTSIQNDLFDLGADLCVPLAVDEKPGARLRITAEQVQHLERTIDTYTTRLEPLRSFILPGGSPAASWLHVARVVCRRAELAVAPLATTEPGKSSDRALVYLNRLSDLLFVMARWANDRGRGDVLWRPGGAVSSSGDTAARPRRAPGQSSKTSRGRRRPRRRT
jgi:cob(I)alamin adenosyltransferase